MISSFTLKEIRRLANRMRPKGRDPIDWQIRILQYELGQVNRLLIYKDWDKLKASNAELEAELSDLIIQIFALIEMINQKYNMDLDFAMLFNLGLQRMREREYSRRQRK